MFHYLDYNTIMQGQYPISKTTITIGCNYNHVNNHKHY